jgi:hypothetical protein
MDRDTQALANALARWVEIDGHLHPASAILRDAIIQATLPATINWLAAIAERHGFVAPPST